MKNFIQYFYCFATAIFILFGNVYGIKDSSNIAIAPTVIKDSAFVHDSLNVIKKKTGFATKRKHIINNGKLFSFSLSKRKIDFLDYKYSGDILLNLPFTSLIDFGYTGAPNEPNIYTFGYGNISLTINGNTFNNRWNNSSNLNRVQTEDIYSIHIVPLPRTFLFGVINNPAAINIVTNDSLKSKPISRIRYYQAPNEEGFIDAMFSARVLSKLAVAFRLTNISSKGNLGNTEHGSWKADFKGIYKLNDSLFAKINYYHLKSETGLYSGVDVSSLSNGGTSQPSQPIDIYSQIAPVTFNNRNSETIIHNVSASMYGSLFNNNFTKISIGQNYNADKFKQSTVSSTTDTVKINNENKYTSLFVKLTTEHKFGNLRIKLKSGYEENDFNIDDINYNEKQKNYYLWSIAQYGFFNNSLIPSIYGKLSEVDSQSNNGAGFDLSFRVNQNLKIFLGISNFQKPYSIIEKHSLNSYGNSTQSFNTQFASLEFRSSVIQSSLSYFNVQSFNLPIPVFNYQDISLSDSEIIFNNIDNLNYSGVNLFANIKFWKFLTSVNLNYYRERDNLSNSQSSKYNLKAGIYYVDTLYNSNLFLKTGFTFYLFKDADYKIYDFQKLRSARYYLSNSTFVPFEAYGIKNNPYRLDFFLAGRVQNLATFFLVFENILFNNYFTIPYYPMPEGRLRIGISWDFIN